MDRRAFLRLAGAATGAAAIGVPLISGISGANSSGQLLPSQRPLPAPFSVPLTNTTVLRPDRVDATTDYYTIDQRVALAEILPGVRTQIWGYNGIFPGPTIVSRRGRRVVVRHRNWLPVPVVVHLHGGHTPHPDDGYPTDLLLPAGKSRNTSTDMPMPSMPGMPDDPHAVITAGQRDYTYPLDQRAATLWYHDHRMGFTGASVWRGLAGFHLVRDDEEAALPLPAGDRELPLMIADRSFAADGSLRYPSVDPTLRHTPGVTADYTAGVLGDVILVNGRPWPVANVVGARYRLRLLNACNARRLSLALDPAPPGGHGLVQIGTDGGLLAEPIEHDTIEMAPAQRFDVLVDFARYPPGQLVTLVNTFDTGNLGVVLRFVVGDRTADESRVPDRLSTLESLRPNASTVTRTLLFQDRGGDMGWQINGQPFSPTSVAATPALGGTEIWRLVTDFHHPIHLHLAPFQVLSRGLSGPGEYDHGWRDTIDLRPAEEAKIIVRFDDYAGRFVFHCHNLEHEDMAMMGNFVVTG